MTVEVKSYISQSKRTRDCPYDSCVSSYLQLLRFKSGKGGSVYSLLSLLLPFAPTCFIPLPPYCSCFFLLPICLSSFFFNLLPLFFSHFPLSILSLSPPSSLFLLYLFTPSLSFLLLPSLILLIFLRSAPKKIHAHSCSYK